MHTMEQTRPLPRYPLPVDPAPATRAGVGTDGGGAPTRWAGLSGPLSAPCAAMNTARTGFLQANGQHAGDSNLCGLDGAFTHPARSAFRRLRYGFVEHVLKAQFRATAHRGLVNSVHQRLVQWFCCVLPATLGGGLLFERIGKNPWTLGAIAPPLLCRGGGGRARSRQPHQRNPGGTP
jgi:hypothetical protein